MVKHHTPALVFVCVLVAAAPARAQPLHDAVRAGDLAEAERLLGAGANPESPDEDGLTPLVVAALAGKLQLVELLIARGADPRGRDAKGFTALHAAAHHGHADVARSLLALGADVNDQANRARITPLHAAAERNFRAVVDVLLAHGAELDREERNGWSPIMRATFKAYAGLVKLFRELGARCSSNAGEAYLKYCRTAGS